MSKIIISQKFDNSLLQKIIELVKERNLAASRGDLNSIERVQIEINKFFKPFDLTGSKNYKLQRIKYSIDLGYNSAKIKAQNVRLNPTLPIPFETDIPFGGDFQTLAQDIYNNAKNIATNSNDKEEIKSLILLNLQSEYSDILNNFSLKEKLLDQLKEVSEIDFGSSSIVTTAPVVTRPSVTTEQDKILEFIKEANQYAKNGELNQVQRVQFEVEKIFKNQYDIFEKDKSGNYLNPKLRLLYDRTLQHFKKLKDYANKVKSRGKNNEGYVFPAEYRKYSDFDQATEALAKDLIAKAKSEIKNPDHKKDLRNRIEWLIQTGHDKILDNPILKNKLYETIKNKTSIDLNKPVTASLKKLNKIIIALEKNNFIKEAEIVDKIFDKLTKIENHR